MSIALKFQEYEEIGEARGIEIGEARGIEKGKEIGSLANTVSLVRDNKEEATEEQIIKFLRIDKQTYRKISEMIEDNPDKSDWEIAEAILADAVVPVSASLIEGMPNLKLTHSEGVAYNRIDTEAARRAGVYVCNDLFYALLHHFRGAPVRVGFIHVPFLPQQGEPSLPQHETVAALTAAIRAI